MQTQRTETKRTVRWLSTLLLLGVILTFTFPMAASAGGTDPTTPVSNMAVITYSVGSVVQPTVDSSTVSFLVDRKVDLIMSPGTGTFSPVTPNTQVVWAVQLENQGNDTHGYRFNILDLGSNTFQADNVYVYLDTGVIGTLEAGDTLYSTYNWDGATYTETEDSSWNAGNLIKDGTLDILVVADIPGTAADGQVAEYYITATTVNNGSAGTPADDTTQDTGGWTANAVQTVFGDGHGPNDTGEPDSPTDGKFSVQVSYTVGTATLTATKSQTVIDDGIPGSVAPFKAIPGATVTYSIAIANSSAATAASSVSVADSIPANTTYVADSVTINTLAVLDTDARVVLTGASPVTAVTIDAGAIAAGATTTVTFNVTID